MPVFEGGTKNSKCEYLMQSWADSLGLSGDPPLFYMYYAAPGCHSCSFDRSKMRSYHAIHMYSDVAGPIITQKIGFRHLKYFNTWPKVLPKFCSNLIGQLCQYRVPPPCPIREAATRDVAVTRHTVTNSNLNPPNLTTPFLHSFAR